MVKISSKTKTKKFSTKCYIKKFITTKPILKEMLKKVIQDEENDIRWKLGSKQRREEP